MRVQRGRTELTPRELRLAGGDLGLPEVQDKLGARLRWGYAGATALATRVAPARASSAKAVPASS
jgi:hypothetical protein